VIPLWILMSYGITAEGRLSSQQNLNRLGFCFAVGVVLPVRRLEGLTSDALSLRQEPGAVYQAYFTSAPSAI